MQRKILSAMLVMLILLVACSQPEATPTPPELATTLTALPSNEKPTIEPTAREKTIPPTVASTKEPTAPATAVPTNLPPTPEPIEPETYSAQVAEYNLGQGTIIQDHFPEDSRFRKMPVRLEGVIGVPEAKGPFPVILILHGSHRVCPTAEGRENDAIWPCPAEMEQPNYAGFTYLVEALAEAGYVALSINVNAENTFAFGESPPRIRTMQLINLHLQELLAANAGESDKLGLDLTGRVDPSRMAWIGHSRGADLVNWIVRDNELDVAVNETGFGPVQGLLLVAPPAIFTEALPTADLPIALILPTCDGDVRTLDGQKFYESARFDAERSRILTSVYLNHGNHNNFNTVLTSDAILEDRPDCAEGAVLDPSDQQAFLSRYAVDFLRRLYGPPNNIYFIDRDLGLDPASPAPMELYAFPVQITTLHSTANRLTLSQPKSEAELSRNLLGGETIFTGLMALFCPEGYYVPNIDPEKSEPCRRVAFNQPAFPQQILVNWETSGAELRTSISEAHADISEYTALQLRAAIDPISELNQLGEPQSFTVELVDRDGNRARSVAASINYPVGVTQPNDFFGGEYFTGQVPMQVIHIPLAAFSDVDLSNIAEVALVFDQTPKGALFVADWEFVKPKQGPQ